tara:strand:+ start:554 stop:1264 length:711 start_codon:yes stop_codon:yes gene_type:complete
MMNIQKIKWKRLLNELEYLHEEMSFATDISKDGAIEFDQHYRSFCVKNEIDLEKLSEDNKDRLDKLYGKGEYASPTAEVPEIEYSGSTAITVTPTTEEPPEIPEIEDTPGMFKKLHDDFHKVFKKLALKLHPDKIDNHILSDEEKRSLAFDFARVKNSFEKKKYFQLIKLSKKYGVFVPDNYTLQVKWFRRERDRLRKEVEALKTTYNYTFTECETDEQRDTLIKQFIWHLFKHKA